MNGFRQPDSVGLVQLADTGIPECTGFDNELLRTIPDRVQVPVTASGGAGSPADMTAAVAEGHADAVLAASIFHRDIHSIAAVKADMAAAGVPVRITEEAA